MTTPGRSPAEFQPLLRQVPATRLTLAPQRAGPVNGLFLSGLSRLQRCRGAMGAAMVSGLGSRLAAVARAWLVCRPCGGRLGFLVMKNGAVVVSEVGLWLSSALSFSL